MTVLRVRGVLFDNDGVLIDSTASVELAWRTFAGWYGLPAADLLAGVHGRRSRDVIEQYADRLPVSVEVALARLLGDVAGEGPMTVLPGAAALLGSLPPRGWAVVTSGTRGVAGSRLATGGLPTPPVLVSADDVPAGKPDPAPYRIAAERLGLSPADCLAIEDAPAGLASARAAGCHTLALLTTHPRAALTADHHTPDLTTVRITPTNDGFEVRIDGTAP
jgi:sugar-phosphatase